MTEAKRMSAERLKRVDQDLACNITSNCVNDREALRAHIAALEADLEAAQATALEAFVAGFLVSSEGYNGEYPHDFTDGETVRKELLPDFETWLSKRALKDQKP